MGRISGPGGIIHTSIYIYIYIYIRIYTFLCIRIYIYMCMCPFFFMYVYVCGFSSWVHMGFCRFQYGSGIQRIDFWSWSEIRGAQNASSGHGGFCKSYRKNHQAGTVPGMYAYMYIYIYISIYILICIYVYMYTYSIHIYIYTYMNIYVYMYAHSYVFFTRC